MQVTINVTRGDIDLGQRGLCLTCPIALAITRVIDWMKCYASVGIADVRFGYHGEDSHGRTEMPKEASRFIVKFDSRSAVEPFSFNLDIPDQFLPQGVKSCATC